MSFSAEMILVTVIHNFEQLHDALHFVKLEKKTREKNIAVDLHIVHKFSVLIP